MSADIRWFSQSQFCAYLRCAEAWHDRYMLGIGGNEVGDGATYGLGGHNGIEAFLMGGHISSDSQNVSEQDGLALAARFCETWDQFPAKDMRLCVEQHGIPAKYRADKGDVPLMGIILAPGIGLRCRLDLAYLTDDGAFAIDDWSVSTKPTDEAAIQAACNVVIAAEVWKGFPEYRVRHIDLHKPHSAEWLVFSPADIQAAKREILTLIKTMLADTNHPATINRYCGGCHRRDACPAYVSALTVEPVKSMVSKLSMHRLEVEDTRVKDYLKLLADYRNEIGAEMISRVQAGPIQEGQDEWALSERAGARKWDVDPVAQLAVAALEARTITLDQFSAIFSVVASGVDGLKKAAPDLHAQVNALATRTPTPVVKKRPAQGIEIQSTHPGEMPEWTKGSGCRPDADELNTAGSNPALTTIEEVAPIEHPQTAPLLAEATGADTAETLGAVPCASSPCVAPAGADTGHSVLPPALAAAVERAGDLPPVDTSDLPILTAADPWICPHCAGLLRPVVALAPLRGHHGLSCQAHGVVAWTPDTVTVGDGTPVEEIPFAEPPPLCGDAECEFPHVQRGDLQDGWEHELTPGLTPRRRIAKGYRGESLEPPWRRADPQELARARVRRQPPPSPGDEGRKNWLVAEIAKRGEQSVAALCGLPVEELEALFAPPPSDTEAPATKEVQP